MKKKFKGLLSIVLLLMVMCMTSFSVSAAEGPLDKLSTKTRETTLGQMSMGMGCDYFTPDYSSKINMTAKSSNTKVVKVKAYDFKNDYTGKYSAGFETTALAPGKAKITITVKNGSKTYKKSFDYVVYKYENPFKTLKIGSKSYQSKFKSNGSVALSKSDMKGKLSISMNSNFILNSIRVYYNSEDGQYNNKTIKNRGKLPSGTYLISFSVTNKKTKNTFTVGFSSTNK